MDTDKIVEIYTDGSCNHETYKGGIGIYCNELNISISKGYFNTTSNRMELLAIITALETIIDLKLKNEYIIYSDSQYVVKSINIWLKNWLKKDKLTGRVNEDLWRRFLAVSLLFPYPVKYVWVKGHSTNLGNLEADNLANYLEINQFEKDR